MALHLGADLHKSCLEIIPRHPDYAVRPIQTGFDWSSLSGYPFERLYLVVFRSVRRPDADLDLLREHDDRAYEGGECLSFCLWETRESAKVAAGAASHQSAADITARMYVSYVLDRY